MRMACSGGCSPPVAASMCACTHGCGSGLSFGSAAIEEFFQLAGCGVCRVQLSLDRRG